MTPTTLKNVDVQVVSAKGPQEFISTVQSFGLDTWDWVAIIIAAVSLCFTFKTLRSQRETEKNTMKITEEGQFELLIDYIRHFYANLVVVLAVLAKLNKRYNTHYPSEEHFRKLIVDLEVLHPEAFVHSQDRYDAIHNLYILIRNFNTECGVAEKHISSKDVCIEAKKRDFNTLIFKQDYFVGRFIDCIKKLCGSSEEKYDRYIDKARKVVIERAIARNNVFGESVVSDITDEEKSKQLKGLIEAHKIPNYWYNVKARNLVNRLMHDDKDKDLFKSLLDCAVWCELEGENNGGYDKILIIDDKANSSQQLKEFIAAYMIPNYWDKVKDSKFAKLLLRNPNCVESFMILLTYIVWRELGDKKDALFLNKDKEDAIQQAQKIIENTLQGEDISKYWKEVTESNFVKLLFPDEKEEEFFVDLLNYNIWCEINGNNSQGYEKIFIIPF